MPRKRRPQNKLRVQSKMCSTCIYRKNSPLDLARLENEVRDKHMPEHFARFRACHHVDSNDVVCRGFWNRHAENCTPTQIASRLGLVEFVKEDDHAK